MIQTDHERLRQMVPQCPHCGGEMTFGYVGPAGAVRFVEKRPWFWTIIHILRGKRIMEGGSAPAGVCTPCGLVVLQGPIPPEAELEHAALSFLPDQTQQKGA